ncbi:hypothetical protein I302_104603 [Kwoniella bestiolae CBS 10118]|uniref:Sugar phosphate transporter domain-containing protein n=1 Tax=Kwoniella bestiolae CBS 10118 TaxID=1296100 RepID=A0A1B9GBQ0_9TREE|nr:hypothetical protein I302_03310 [Kwoniella bestiolae CBS 10118]OCF28451.1 hypothetical protein I302_03310 [Kwoniella bestiolae CBS 10118]
MSSHLAPTPQQPLNRYIPQSPQPDSPPQTPSPISPGKSTLELGMDATTGASEQPVSSTPEGYSYSSTSNTPGAGAGVGIGINFPPESNPLPKELHSPVLNGGGSVSINQYSMAAPPVVMQRRKSSEGAVPFPQEDTAGSTGMSHSLSAGSTSSQQFPNQPAVPQHNLSPFPNHLNTPPRPRTVSPRHNLTGTANGGATFASSSSLGKGYINNEPRERVLSPHKSDMPSSSAGGSGGVFSDQQEENHNHLDPNNPYGQPNEKTWEKANSSFSSFGGVGSQPYFPLTGKEHLVGNSPTVQPKKVPFTDSVGFWLGLYFCFNLGLTLFNKFVLVSFPFPYTLTGLHALSGCAGTYIALEQGAFTPARLTQKENVILAAFSVLYTINIAVSNISLQLVSIPFHQVVRASTPLFTIFIAAIFLRARFSALKLVSLLPVVAGVGFATYGDYDFTALGLILTLLGTFLAALKTVVTNLIQTGGGGRLKLHPLDLLMRMSPLAFIQCVIYGWYTGELERVRRYGATQMTRSKAIALLFNGVFAFGLNIVSFTANKKAGALTMTVSANCKQVLTIVLAVMLFNLHISPTNGLGILLTLVGGGWYGYVEYIEKKKKTKVLERA